MKESLLLSAILSGAPPSEEDVRDLYARSEEEFGQALASSGKTWCHPPVKDALRVYRAALEEWRHLNQNPEEQDFILMSAFLSLNLRVLRAGPEERDSYYWDLVASDAAKLFLHSLEAEGGQPNPERLGLYLSWPAAHYLLVFDPNRGTPGKVDLLKIDFYERFIGSSLREEGGRTLSTALRLGRWIENLAENLGAQETE